jgi:hypothetical protein
MKFFANKIIRTMLAAVIACTFSVSAHAQILNDIARRAKNAVETRTKMAADRAVQKTLDKAEDSVEKGAKSAVRGNKKANPNAPANQNPANKNTAKGGIYYVSESGNNQNDGLTPETPVKNIQKAVDIAPEGSTLYVAEGNYYGLLRSGTITINKPLYIYGGFNSDFSKRDILNYRTMVQPTLESNGTMKMGTIMLDIQSPGSDLVLDGIIFDRGNSISYTSSQREEDKGQPEGVETPRMNPIGTMGLGGPNLESREALTNETAILYLNNSSVDLTIQNCAFLNAPSYAILGLFKGHMQIDNSIFVNCRMAAIDVRGSDAKENQPVDFTNNTVLFSWSRLKDFLDMGYGFRFLPGTDCYLANNIFGCSIFAGIDYTHIDSDKNREASRNTIVEDNIFFLNREGDLTIPGGGKFMRVSSVDFGDVEYLDRASGNKTVSDASIFKGKIDEAYLKGFINASYSESTNYDPNSAVNTFRQAFGMNMTGTMTSTSSMFANRYNWKKALELFGAMDGYGAQLPE